MFKRDTLIVLSLLAVIALSFRLFEEEEPRPTPTTSRTPDYHLRIEMRDPQFWGEIAISRGRVLVVKAGLLFSELGVAPNSELLVGNGQKLDSEETYWAFTDNVLTTGKVSLKWRCQGSEYLRNLVISDVFETDLDTPPPLKTVRKTPKIAEFYRVREKCILREPFGLQVGDKVISVNSIAFTSPYENLQDLYDELNSKESLTIRFARDGEEMTVIKSLEELKLGSVKKVSAPDRWKHPRLHLFKASPQ